MDEEVARLVRAEHIVEAAEVASKKGDAPLASELFERACDFARASSEALHAGDHARALLLAVTAGDARLAEQALPKVCADARAWDRVAHQLEQQGSHAWAARVLEQSERGPRAAQAWERAGEAVRASALWERSGDPVRASKALEAALRRNPDAHACALALGRLLLRYGKLEPAVRALQRVPEGAPERRAALTAMSGALARLGLAQAEDECKRELDRLGGPVSEAGAPEAGELKRRIFGRYEVVREVASTPSARVLECVDSVKGEHVAVKVFAAWDVRGGGRDALARFEREVKVLGRLDHPNVVPLRDYVEDGPAIVMAWMGGGTLEKMMEQPLAPARAVEIALAVLSALGEAHRLGVLHRDVKPANVLFDDAGVARLGDFGVAHLSDASATATAGVIGTLAYMSPEQREGRPATVQSDLYGVGAILWEMLTGERMSSGEPPRTRPSGVHRDLDVRHDEAVLRFVAPDPAERPADAFAARRALGALTWPKTVERAALPERSRAPSKHPGPDRLEPDALRPGRAIDRWAERAIERVPLDERTLARAGAFARAAHPSLQTVLRVDRALGEVWLEAPRGGPASRALTPAELDHLRRALSALHGEGVVHGQVDRAHVCLDGGTPTLLFEARPEPAATADTDFAAAARLAAPPA